MKNGTHNSMIPNQNFSRGNNIQTNFKTNPLKNRNTMAPFSILNPSTTFTNRTYDINKGNIEENAEIHGTLKYSSDSKVNISKSAKVGYTEIEESNSKSGVVVKSTIKTKITDGILSLLNILAIGLIMMLIMPKVFEKIAKQDEKNILSNLGFGALALFTAPLVALICMITVVGLSTGFILLGIYFICLYVSTVFASYFLSNLIFGKKIKNKYLVYLVGAAIITVLKLIPFISIPATNVFERFGTFLGRHFDLFEVFQGCF